MLGVPLELRGREISYLNSLVSYEHRLLVLHELVWLKYLGSRIEYGPMSDLICLLLYTLFEQFIEIQGFLSSI
jgi:hypothetical protein